MRRTVCGLGHQVSVHILCNKTGCVRATGVLLLTSLLSFVHPEIEWLVCGGSIFVHSLLAGEVKGLEEGGCRTGGKLAAVLSQLLLLAETVPEGQKEAHPRKDRIDWGAGGQ